MGVGMRSGLALCLEIAKTDGAAATTAAAVATAAASAAWLFVPAGRRFVARADAEVLPPMGRPERTGACPLGYGQDDGPGAMHDYRKYKVRPAQGVLLAAACMPRSATAHPAHAVRACCFSLFKHSNRKA